MGHFASAHHEVISWHAQADHADARRLALIVVV